MADEPQTPEPSNPEPQPQPEPEPSNPVEARRRQLVSLREEIRSLSGVSDMNETQETRLAAALDEFPALEQRVRADETRSNAIAAVNRSRTGSAPGFDQAPGQINRNSPFGGDLRTMDRGEVRDRAFRVLEDRGKHLQARQADHLDRLLRSSRNADFDPTSIARRMLLSESDEYRSAFLKAMSGNFAFYPDEVRALNEMRSEMRAASEGTLSAGGYGVPVLIDPSIILTSGAAAAPLLDISRIVTITTDQWKGVSSAGFDWAYQAEAAVVADNTPTLAQPTIPVYASRGFIPYTLEIGDDYPGFQEEMANLMSQGYLNLMARKTMVGSGSGEPTGIFTAMQNATIPAHVTVTTAGTLGAVDVRSAWAALPERFRPNSSYVMNVEVENLIRAWGNNLALSDYTVNMQANGTGVLTGRPVVLSDYAPTFTNTTGPESALVVGDFQHFVIVQRAGMTVELVPHLFDPTTGRPIGERGWFAWARAGHNVDSTNAFRLVSNT